MKFNREEREGEDFNAETQSMGGYRLQASGTIVDISNDLRANSQ